MAVLTSFTTGQDDNAAIGDITDIEFDRAQGFKIPTAGICTSVELYLKNGAGGAPTDAVTIRIETDSSGPSGNLVAASATGTIAAAAIGASYAFEVCTFSAGFILLPSTTYFLRATVPSQSTNIHFDWGFDSEQGYADGSLYTSTNGGAWADSSIDALFIVNGDFIGGTQPGFEI